MLHSLRRNDLARLALRQASASRERDDFFSRFGFWEDVVELRKQAGDLRGAAYVLQQHGEHWDAACALLQLLAQRVQHMEHEQRKAEESEGKGEDDAEDGEEEDSGVVMAARTQLGAEVWDQLGACLMAVVDPGQLRQAREQLVDTAGAAEAPEAQHLHQQLIAYSQLLEACARDQAAGSTGKIDEATVPTEYQVRMWSVGHLELPCVS